MMWKDPRTWSAVGAFIFVIVLSMATVGYFVDSRSEDRGKERQQEQIQACQRGNLVRGYLLLRAREFKQADDKSASRTTELAPAVFAIINCDETVHHRGNEKNLNDVEAERYLVILNRGRMPIVSTDGRVVGERALPAA